MSEVSIDDIISNFADVICSKQVNAEGRPLQMRRIYKYYEGQLNKHTYFYCMAQNHLSEITEAVVHIAKGGFCNNVTCTSIDTQYIPSSLPMAISCVCFTMEKNAEVCSLVKLFSRANIKV